MYIMYIYICICMYVYMYLYVCIYIYMYTHSERERERVRFTWEIIHFFAVDGIFTCFDQKPAGETTWKLSYGSGPPFQDILSHTWVTSVVRLALLSHMLLPVVAGHTPRYTHTPGTKWDPGTINCSTAR